MIVSGWQKTSFIDLPGGICSTVFLAGCNFRCPYCHNPQLVMGSPDLPKYEMAELRTVFSNRKHLLDGVCVSGGEPTLCEDLKDLLYMIKRIGLKAKLDTNGSRPERLREFLKLGLLDYVAMDVKAPPFKYEKAAGVPVDVRAIEKSVILLKSSGVEHEFRTTVAPSLLSVSDVEAIGQWLSGSARYVLQPCWPGINLDPSFSPGRIDDKWLESLRDMLQPYFGSVILRGVGLSVLS